MNFDIPRRRALDNLIRPTRAEVSAPALRHNLRVAQRLAAPAEVMAVAPILVVHGFQRRCCVGRVAGTGELRRGRCSGCRGRGEG